MKLERNKKRLCRAEKMHHARMKDGTYVRRSLAAIETGTSASSIVQPYLALTKPRIAAMIAVSTAVGYFFGQEGSFALVAFLHAVFGTTLLAAGSATLNQWYERDIDARMNRTSNRPLPGGVLTPAQAFSFGIFISVLGLLDLAIFANFLAAGIGFATWAGYLGIYTPLKRISPFCTTIGALPGAAPPLVGYAAARGYLMPEAWILFAILFLWQFPHFHAIAWMYREDYERGGVKMLAVVRPDGNAVSQRIICTLLLLLPVSLLPALIHPAMAGTVYLVSAFILGLVFFYFGWKVARERTYVGAKRLLLASVAYLPLLFAVLILNRP
jgi:protoheme IX farnesyltransferase